MSHLSVKNFFLFDSDLQSQAILTKDTTINYDQLSSMVNSVQNYLAGNGISENVHVALPGINNVDLIGFTVALWRLGAIPVPFNPKFKEAELNKLIELSNCEFVLVTEEIKLKLKNTSAKLIGFYFNPGSEADKISNFDLPEFNKTAVIIFTSGTSASPKAVELSFKSIFESAKIGNKILGHNQNDKWLASLPFFHISGFSIITRALLFRVPVIIPESLNENDIKEAIEIFKPSLCSFVPTQLKRLKEMNIENIEQIRHVLIGGGYADSKLITEAIQNGWNITKVYGSTETCAFVTAITSNELLYKPKSVGKAVTPNLVSVISDKHISLSAGEPGEIIIESPAIMKGYYRNPEETKEKFYNEFFLTGDIGFLDEEGDLFVEARRTDLIVTGGENVNPYEIETELINHPKISDAIVFPMEDEEWGQIVAAAIVPYSNESEPTLDDIKIFLEKELTDYKIPKKIFIKQTLPVNDIGKVDRQQLIDMITAES